MSVYVAFYKGRPRDGASFYDRMKYIADWLIRKITRSPYSHCEIAIKESGGVYYCVTSSLRDGGVRWKRMYLPDDRWDLLPCNLTVDGVMAWLDREKGSKYDYGGVFRFILPFIPQSRTRWFCSEFVAAVLGMRAPELQTPQDVYEWLQSSK